MHGYQRSVAAAGVEIPDDALTVTLIAYEAAPASEGALERLAEGCAAYRAAVHGALIGYA